MTVGKLVEQLQKCDPKARVVTGNFIDNSEILFAVCADNFPGIVLLESEADIDIGEEISARYNALYKGLNEVGFSVEQVKETIGDTEAELYRQWLFED